jgi:hypothetical protein
LYLTSQKALSDAFFLFVPRSALGRLLPVVTVRAFSNWATCYAGPNGQDRPAADALLDEGMAVTMFHTVGKLLMKLNVTRQAVCGADDQLNDLEMALDISDETTLAECISCIQEAKFLQFSSTRSEATGYLNGEAVVRLFEGRSAEYLIDADSVFSSDTAVLSLSFRFVPQGIRSSPLNRRVS